MFNFTIERLPEELGLGRIAIQTQTKGSKKYYRLSTLLSKGNWELPRETEPFKIEGELLYAPVIEGTTIAFGAFVEEKVMMEILNGRTPKE